MAAASLNDSFLSILLVGKTGYGKSSTGNTIIGEKDAFKSKKSFTSVTKTCQREVARVQGRKVVVVDTPGLADTDMKTHESVKQLAAEVATILAQQTHGFNAILIVISLAVRLTEEDVQVCKRLDGLFGKNFTKHFGIVLVTHADAYDPEENDSLAIEEHLVKEDGLFQQMLEKCNNRMVCFDNKSKDRDIRNKQLTALLKMADEIKTTSSGYKSETFEKAKKYRDKFLSQVLKQEIYDELKLISKEYHNIPQDCMDVKQYEDIISKLQNFEKALIDLNKDTNTSTFLILGVFHLEATVKSIIRTIQDGDDNTTRITKIQIGTEVLYKIDKSIALMSSGPVRSFIQKMLGITMSRIWEPVLSSYEL